MKNTQDTRINFDRGPTRASTARTQRTQEDMELSLRGFIERLNFGAPGSIDEGMAPRFESCDLSGRSFVSSFVGQDWMQNPVGNVHGGIIGTAFDEAIGTLAFFAAGDKMAPTVSLQVSYIRPVPLGRRFYIRSWINSSGRTLINAMAEAWLEGEEDSLVATATASYFA